MNEHGGHIHYPAFIGNEPVTKEDIDTVIAYAGSRPASLSSPEAINFTVYLSLGISSKKISDAKRAGK